MGDIIQINTVFKNWQIIDRHIIFQPRKSFQYHISIFPPPKGLNGSSLLITRFLWPKVLLTCNLNVRIYGHWWLTKLTNTPLISVHQSNCTNNYCSSGSDLHLCFLLSFTSTITSVPIVCFVYHSVTAILHSLIANRDSSVSKVSGWRTDYLSAFDSYLPDKAQLRLL
jgi:hypothetical protein